MDWFYFNFKLLAKFDNILVKLKFQRSMVKEM